MIPGTTTNNHANGDATSVARDHDSKAAHRRSRPTPSQVVIVRCVVAIGAVLGALSGGAPTGHVVVDVVYRAAFVAVLAVAASRARRAAVIIAAALAAAGSLGVGLVYGGAALIMAAAMVGSDVRNRVYGAVIGVLIGMSLLRLQLDWFLGASALVAALAASLLIGSAFRVSRANERRRVRWALGVVAAVMVIGLGMAAYQAIAFTSPLEDAVSATTRGVGEVQDGATDAGAVSLASASDAFAAVAEDANRWWLFPSRLVPVVGQNVRVVATMADAGARLTATASELATDVDYSSIRREGGGVDLAQLAAITAPVERTARELAAASADVDEVRSPWVVAPLDDRVDDFDRRVADLEDQTDLAVTALRAGPAVFGGEGPRRYLVLLGNPAELRDLGGHIGNWAELTIDDGVLDLVEVGRPLELAQPELESALAETEVMPLSFMTLRPATFPQNWGGTVDFPTAADIAARLYGQATGRPVDGVLYADPYALAAMLQLTGPVPIPGLTGRTLSAADAVDFLTLGQFAAYENPSDGDEALTTLIEDVFQRLTTTTLPGPRELGELFGPLVREGRFRMVSVHATDHELLGRVGLDNGFPPTEGEDLLAVVSRNANPSKIDSFLLRSTRYDVDWDPSTGATRATVTVVMKNQADPDGLPPYVVGNTAGLPSGTNVTDLAVMTPFEVLQATVDGAEVPVSPLREQGVWRHSVRLAIPPGQTVRVRFALEGEVDPGRRYRLRVSGQPLVTPGEMFVTVRARGSRIAPGPGIEVSGGRATAGFTELGQTRLTLRDDS